MFLRAMAWKEFREQRLQALILTALGLLILGFVFPMFDLENDAAGTLPMAAVVFAWAGGLVTGAIALANEREMHTQSFLDLLPRRRLQIWLAKLFVALILVAIQSALLVGMALAAAGRGHSVWFGHPGMLVMLALLSGAYGLGCGLFGSALGRTVLAAIGWSIVALVGSSFIAGLALVVLELIAREFERIQEIEPLQFLAWLIVLPFPGALSALVYSGLDRKRRYELGLPLKPRFRLAPSSFGLRSALWLSFRQGWALFVGLGAFIVLTAPLYSFVDPLIVWPIVTLIVGLLMGVATLADEQYYGAFKFLADQRLPLGRLWCFKIGSRFLLTVVLIAVGALVPVMGHELARQLFSIRLFEQFDWNQREFAARRAGIAGLLAMWGLYGFAFGHLAAMLARKSVIALVIALAGAIIGLTVWVPSLVSGALPSWQILGLPFGILVIARLSFWAWATDRLLSRKVLVGWGAAAAAIIGFVIACMANRVIEVPAAAEPKGIAEFEASYPPREENPVRARFIQAEELVRREFGLDHGDWRLIDLNSAPAPHGTNSRLNGNRVLLALALGWPKEDADERRIAQRLAKFDWLTPLLAAAAEPPLPVDVPRDEPLMRQSISQRAFVFGPWLAFRALHEQSRGAHSEALDLLVADFALARRLMTRATASAYETGQAVESAALYGLQRWAEHRALPDNLLPRALKELQRHEAERPPFDEVLRAEYLRQREFASGRASRSEQAGTESWQHFLRQSAVLAPWERARRERLLNGLYQLQAQESRLDYPTWLARFRRWHNRTQHLERLLIMSALPPDDSDEQRRFLQLSELVWSDLVLSAFTGWQQINRNASRFTGLCQTRALQIWLALQIFQQRRGRAAANLDELVPAVLPDLPHDPFSEKPFRYRLISANEWVRWREDARPDEDPNWVVKDEHLPVMPEGAIPPVTYRPVTHGDDGATHRRLQPGTALLWSVGPDGADNRGIQQHSIRPVTRHHFLYIEPGTDMLFSVPPPRRAK